MMNRYIIGRIEGRWTNFEPPIRGGMFRPLCPEQLEDELEDQVQTQLKAESTSDTPDSSRAASPVFDREEQHGLHYRSARTTGVKRSSSLSSISSLEDNETTGVMSHLDVRTKTEINLDLAKYPALDAATQDEVVRKYRLLNDKIRERGLYNCNYSSYAIEISRYSTLFGLMLYFLHIGWYGISGMFLGMFWHQLVFSAHDAGHMGITHSFTVDTAIGVIIADFLGGLSLGWWKRSHNVHHIITNSPEHDPDIEHMPFFAISHRLLQSLYSTYHNKLMAFDAFAKVMLPIQNYMYYPILTFGRFNLYVQSWVFLISRLNPRKGPAWWINWLELAGQAFFWTWFGYGIVYRSIPTNSGRFLFVMISHMVTMPVHCQITLSHFAMSTADLGPHESFPQRMLRTTMDVDCPQWLDFFHGGLQFQAIHHLYPRIPRHNLRATQKLVQEFCEDVGIPYALYGFVDGNKQVIGRLGEVARQAAILKKCQQTIVEKGEILGH